MINPYFKFHDCVYTIIDQTLLPHREVYLDLHSVEDYFNAIYQLKVRGAPAIGVSAAYGIVSAVCDLKISDDKKNTAYMAIEKLLAARPTAVNLAFALNRMKKVIDSNTNSETLKNELLIEADNIRDKEITSCDSIARFGQTVMKNKMNILTHCNTGMLATPGIGTALGVIYRAHESGISVHVYVPETRPLLQGSRLTIFELEKAKIPYTLITDNMRGQLFADNRIDMVITGADRIALNGDTANKIGTLESALMANYYSIPFYIAAPVSTIDFSIQSGNEIIIEHRSPDEVKTFGNISVSIASSVINPAFDVTPATFIRGIITEKGITEPCVENISLLQ